MAVIKFPFSTFQQFNLDWIMEQLHKILQFMPLNGSAGDVLQRTVDGAAWQPISAVSLDIHGLNSTTPDAADELPIYDNDLQGNYKITVQDVLDMVSSPVTSVNGQTGAVVLSIPTDTMDLTNSAGFVDAAGAAAAAPVQSVNGQTGAVIVSGGAVDSVNGQTGTVVLDKTDIGLGNVANVAQYSASNPPPYPVTSVNGMTGDVIVSGGGGSFTPTLVWTNSTPAASFGAQTVSVDLSTYSFIVIEFAARYMLMKTVILKVPDIPPPTGYSVYDQMIGMYVNGSNYLLAMRECQVSAAGVDFTDGVRIDSYNGVGTTDSSVCRPTRIWGF